MIRTLVPLLVIVLLCACATTTNRRLARIQRSDPPRFKRESDWPLIKLASLGVSFAFFIIFLIYPSTSAFVLSTFQCFALDDGRRFMRADFSVDCDSDLYARVWYFTAVMVLIYPLGVPLLYWFMFWLHGSQLRAMAGMSMTHKPFRTCSGCTAASCVRCRACVRHMHPGKHRPR